MAKDFGMALGQGSRVIMQVHYNLLAGEEPGRVAASCVSRRAPTISRRWRRAAPGARGAALPPGHSDGPLCDREAALADVEKRFGEGRAVAD